MEKKVFILLAEGKYAGTFSSEKKAIECVKYEVEKFHMKRHDFESYDLEDADTFTVDCLDHAEYIGSVTFTNGGSWSYELILSIIDDFCN